MFTKIKYTDAPRPLYAHSMKEFFNNTRVHVVLFVNVHVRLFNHSEREFDSNGSCVIHLGKTGKETRKTETSMHCLMWWNYNLPKISNARRERRITKRTKGVRAKYFSSFIVSHYAQQRRNFNKTSGQRNTYITCIYECVWALIARTLKGISLRVTVGKCGGAEKTPSRPRGHVFRRIIFTSFFVLSQLLRRRNLTYTKSCTDVTDLCDGKQTKLETNYRAHTLLFPL